MESSQDFEVNIGESNQSLTSSLNNQDLSDASQSFRQSAILSQSRSSQIDEQPEKAINLITYDQKEGFLVSPDAIELLQNLKEKIGIIAVAGKYRTGKSFLLNRIILNKKENDGFGVGPTINPCTKGLWIWNKPIEVENKPGEPPFKVFIVDSEGIGAFNEDQNHDTRIFLLALLLSSYFVYNSMGTIDENALQNLSLIVNLSKQLQIKNQKAEEADPDDVAKYFPSFLWVVRDFALRLLDQYGNPINSKEYLENALKEQKGTSDNIEKKNKIRRLIVNFFKDRDCYTMVRPTEEEKDLQALQKMNDERLRPEFIEQMTTLRARIFKRVKPKVLNGKFITGELFLELCQAYVTAINKGSVPCIESAWTYLCQNECQRAIQESIQLYEKEINTQVFLNFKKTECVNYNEVKQIHKKLKEESILYFKDKAVGQNLKEFEGKILDEISKKYLIVKQKCMQIYEQKCQELIKKEVENIEQQIRQDLYSNVQDFNKDIEKLKQNYSLATQQIIYSQKDSVIKAICEKLIMKGYEAIFRKEKEQLSNQNRQLTEKANYLEKDLQQKKQDYDSERCNLQNKLIDIQAELQNLRANNKIFEEKNRLLEVERSKLESQLQDKVAQLNESKEKIENQLQQQIKEYQGRLKTIEDGSLKSQIQYEKDQALKEQKLTFMERDNQNLTVRVEQLFNENRQLQEKVSLYENQIKQSEQNIKIKDEEKQKELNIMKEFFQKKIDEGKSSETTVSIEKQRQWEQEKQFLQEQLSFSQKQIEENKKMHEVLLTAINQRGLEKEQDQQLIQVNKNLSETIAKVEQRNQQLQQKLSLIKIFQRVFKHSQSMQCKFCQVFFPSEIFVEHVKSCNKDNRYTRSHFFQIPLSISIQQTRIDVDPMDNRQYTEYVVQINFNDKQWVVSQKYRAFCVLHEKLINQYPNIKFPQSSFQFSQKTLNDFGNLKGRGQGGTAGGSSLIEDRRKILQQYLQDLALIPAIKESPQLKQFLEIHTHFPEFCDDIISVQNQLISNQSTDHSESAQQKPKTSSTQLGGNFKLINDLFQKQNTVISNVLPQQQRLIQNDAKQSLVNSQVPTESDQSIRQQLSKKFDYEIEDLISNSNITKVEYNKNRINEQVSTNNQIVNQSLLNQKQGNISSSTTPQKLQQLNSFTNQQNRMSSQENLVTDPDQQYVEDLSSIEGVLLDDDQNTRFLQDDGDMNIGDQYDQEFMDNDIYQYNQQPQPSESPMKTSGFNQNNQQQQSRNNQHMYKSVLLNSGNKGGHQHNHIQSQHSQQNSNVMRNKNNQLSQNEALMKKSTSSNNLMYSPSQIQTSQMTSVLFNDKTNQNIKYTTGSMNQVPTMKENCVACHQKKIIEDELRSSQEKTHGQNQMSQSQNFDQKYMTSSQSNLQGLQQSYQNVTSQKNATLLEELVQKCNNKAKEFGNVAQQRSQIQKQKLESFVTPRDNTGTLLGNLINNAQGQNNYIKTEQAMRSDKILQDLLMRDKNNTSSNKKVTPVKSSVGLQQKQSQQNPYGVSSQQQQVKSPFSGKKHSTTGMTHQLSTNALMQFQQQQQQQHHLSCTPDSSANKRNSVLSNLTSGHHTGSSYKKQQNYGYANEYANNNNSLKKSQTSVNQFDQRSTGGRSSEKIRTQYNNSNL